MDIIILADFVSLTEGSNGRFRYLADMLTSDPENTVEIVTSDFSHGQKARITEVPQGLPYKITLLHEGAYPKNVCIRRFFAHNLWGRNVAKYLKERKKPDVIYAAMPTLRAAYEASKYCRKNGVRFVIDVQDLWPEAYKMVFRIPVVSSIIFYPFQWLAEHAYAGADAICAVSRSYVDRALKENKKCKDGSVVFLGTDLSSFDDNVRENPVKRDDDEIWLGYVGTLGASYDLICVIDALKILDNPKLRLIVMGHGPREEEFKQHAADTGIKADFLGWVPYPEMCGRLTACDIAVNPIVSGSAASIINKHGDYAASGIPVLNTQESREYRNLVEEWNMGFNSKCGDPTELAENLRKLADDPELRRRMGEGARKCAEARFDRRNSYVALVDAIMGK